MHISTRIQINISFPNQSIQTATCMHEISLCIFGHLSYRFIRIIRNSRRPKIWDVRFPSDNGKYFFHSYGFTLFLSRYALTSHPFLLELVKTIGIAIEVNPISNQVLKLVDDLRNHAARPLFSEGYPIVVSNDDPGLWGARALSYDFYEAFMALMSAHADLRSLKQLAMNSLIYSTLSDSEKKKALDIWQKKWNDFVMNISHSIIT